MYGFKIFVSTIITIFMTIIVLSGLKQPGDGVKRVSCMLLIVEALSLIAIWG